MHKEFEKLTTYFCQNLFPLELVQKVIGKKLSDLFNTTNDPVTTVARDILYLSIPFLSFRLNRELKGEILKLTKKFYPQVDLRVRFRNDFTVGSFFKYKDMVDTLLRSNVVYEFSCGQGDATYIGETTRHLCTRIAEHRGVSIRTGKNLSSPKSNIFKHFVDTGHTISAENFKIISNCTRENLKLTESIFIHDRKPNLNNMDSSTPLNIL